MLKQDLQVFRKFSLNLEGIGSLVAQYTYNIRIGLGRDPRSCRVLTPCDILESEVPR